MIIAVTGGTGFIGRRLIARHCAQGDEVRYLTRQRSRDGIAGATAVMGDLTSPPNLLEDSPEDSLKAFADGADILYHAAAELRDESRMHDTNVRGTANLLAAARGRIGRWVQLSSTGVYGTGHHSPAQVDENSPACPANVYEISKDAADRLVCNAASNDGLRCVIVQPSNVYGPDMPNQSLFQLIRMVDRKLFFFIDDGNAVANYVHADNVVDALMRCATAELPGNARRYIVSDHRSLRDFVAHIAKSLGTPPPRHRIPESLAKIVAALGGLVPGFPLSASRVEALTNPTIYRAERIEKELGFVNRIDMESGIDELVRHWREGAKHA